MMGVSCWWCAIGWKMSWWRFDIPPLQQMKVWDSSFWWVTRWFYFGGRGVEAWLNITFSGGIRYVESTRISWAMPVDTSPTSLRQTRHNLRPPSDLRCLSLWIMRIVVTKHVIRHTLSRILSRLLEPSVLSTYLPSLSNAQYENDAGNRVEASWYTD